MLTFMYGLTGERISIQVFRSLKKEAKQKNRKLIFFAQHIGEVAKVTLKQKNKMAHNSNPLETTASILCIARSTLHLISASYLATHVHHVLKSFGNFSSFNCYIHHAELNY